MMSLAASGYNLALKETDLAVLHILMVHVRHHWPCQYLHKRMSSTLPAEQQLSRN
jgi:hypothetical protein